MTEKENNIRRLKTIEGHIRGVQRMVDDDNYCIDVIRQINAIQAALNKISINILDSHLNSCLISADPRGRFKGNGKGSQRNSRCI